MKKADYLLLAALCLLAGWLWWHRPPNNRQKVEIICNGQVIGTYERDREQTVEIAPGITAQVGPQGYRMLHSTCRNQLCVKQGWQAGTPVVCAPNRVILRLQEGNPPLITR